ncbi:MAG: helix-turn-helix transcriptional regulator [Actinomycetales bacterium]|nr:helix-turn-helix transcriptional regulator [Actinomycetales bacterium]
MSVGRTFRGTPLDDLTARARIREAAREQFTEHGFERATIRGIAAAAGVSPGLVRHHFGSKQELRDAVDAHVLQEIHRLGAEIARDGDRGDLGPSIVSRTAIRPYQGYLARALVDRSPIIATMFDQLVDVTEPWIAWADADRGDPPVVDRRTRAAVLNAMALGVPLLHAHLSRVLGVDVFSPEGDRLIALALLDLYSHALLSPELAASARAGLEAGTPEPAG